VIRDTSIEAFHKIKESGLLSQRRWQVYEILFDIGPATGSEVFLEMRNRHTIGLPSNSNTVARLGELRSMGVVKEIGTKVCPVSGQNVISWDVTSKLPVKFEKSEKVKCEHCNGRGYTIDEQSVLDI
jgi:hypothetical protein